MITIQPNGGQRRIGMEMTVTAKGQFTLNKGLMEHLGIKPGERVSITRTPEGLSVTAAKNKTSVEEMLESLRALREAHGGIKITATIDEIQEAIANGYVERGMRGLK
jgi:bifunctional DNA-binding transcriptional regulator/antitoxin component of YhaV-PrlF toxin-antitoxin module